MIPAIRVHLLGQDAWFLPDDQRLQSGPIAPLEHCDSQGRLTEWDGSLSLAHVIDGRIKRHLQDVGSIEEAIAKAAAFNHRRDLGSLPRP